MRLALLLAVVSGADEGCVWGINGTNFTTVSGIELGGILVNETYDRSVRPQVALSESLDDEADNVTVQLYLTSFELDQGTQTMTVRGSFRTWWQDWRLRYVDPWETPGLCKGSSLQQWNWPVSEPSELRIWRPDLYFVNLRDDLIDEVAPGSTTVSADGGVFQTRFTNSVYECSVKASKMPFDSQTCFVEVSSYAYNEKHIVVLPSEDGGIDASVVDGNSQWRIQKTSTDEFVRLWPAGEWSHVRLKVKLKRRSKYHIIYSMLPAVMFLTVCYCGFYIDRSAAPARVAIAVTPVLIMRVLLNSVFFDLQAVSYRIYLSEFLQLAVAASVLCVFQYALVQVYMSRENDAAARRKTLAKLGSRVALYREELQDDDNKDVDDVEEGGKHEERKKFRKACAISRGLDDDEKGDDTSVRYEPASYNPILARDMRELERIFDYFDVDHSGTIEPKEVSRVMRFYGVFIDVDTARDTILNWRYTNGLPIPVDRTNDVFLNLAQFQDFLSSYDTYAISEGDEAQAFLYKPRSLQADVACRWGFFPALIVGFGLHYLAWFVFKIVDT